MRTRLNLQTVNTTRYDTPSGPALRTKNLADDIELYTHSPPLTASLTRKLEAQNWQFDTESGNWQIDLETKTTWLRVADKNLILSHSDKTIKLVSVKTNSGAWYLNTSAYIALWLLSQQQRDLEEKRILATTATMGLKMYAPNVYEVLHGKNVYVIPTKLTSPVQHYRTWLKRHRNDYIEIDSTLISPEAAAYVGYMWVRGALGGDPETTLDFFVSPSEFANKRGEYGFVCKLGQHDYVASN